MQSLLRGGQPLAAAVACRQLTERYPDYAEAWAVGSQIALALKNPAKGIEYAERAMALAPVQSAFAALKIQALYAAGRTREADYELVGAEARCGQHADAWRDVGNAFSIARRYADALRCYTQAAQLDPSSAETRFNLATMLRFFGRLEEAEEEYDRVIALRPHDCEAYYNRSDLRRQTAARNHCPQLTTLIERGFSHPRDEVFVRYALAKELEDLQEYSASFAHLARGASVRRQHMQYDPEIDVQTMARIKAAIVAEQAPVPTGFAAITPIFVVGMPRCGSTLVERILASHSQVHSAEELPHFADALVAQARARRGSAALSRFELIAAAAEVAPHRLAADYLARCAPVLEGRPERFFVDKMPLNHLYCGWIRRAFPHARIVHVVRHPMAVCYAVYKTLFREAYPFSYDLRELARYYGAYRGLMRHWQDVMPGHILEVRYEDLVTDFDVQARRLIEYCGLSWEPGCADFHRSDLPCSTASASQIRQPLYATSLEQWRYYERELEPLRAALLTEGALVDELAPRTL